MNSQDFKGLHLEIRQKSFLLQSFERDAIIQHDVVLDAALDSEVVAACHSDQSAVTAEHGYRQERTDLKRGARERGSHCITGGRRQRR